MRTRINGDDDTQCLAGLLAQIARPGVDRIAGFMRKLQYMVFGFAINQRAVIQRAGNRGNVNARQFRKATHCHPALISHPLHSPFYLATIR